MIHWPHEPGIRRRYRVEILQHVIVGDPHDLQALPLEVRGAISVGGQPSDVCFSVDLDDQLCSGAVEVDDVRSDRLLAAESKPGNCLFLSAFQSTRSGYVASRRSHRERSVSLGGIRCSCS